MKIFEKIPLNNTENAKKLITTNLKKYTSNIPTFLRIYL